MPAGASMAIDALHFVQHILRPVALALIIASYGLMNMKFAEYASESMIRKMI
jgi:hypothetical protein